jgi:hypothetical protein
MSKLWRALAAIAVVAVSMIGFAGTASAGDKCAPGQHGNPHPGFKPGSC